MREAVERCSAAEAVVVVVVVVNLPLFVVAVVVVGAVAVCFAPAEVSDCRSESEYLVKKNADESQMKNSKCTLKNFT